MLPMTYILKGEVQVQAAKGPLMAMLGANAERDFTAAPFVLDDGCVFVL